MESVCLWEPDCQSTAMVRRWPWLRSRLGVCACCTSSDSRILLGYMYQHQPWHVERLTFLSLNLEGEKITHSGIFHVTVQFYGAPESLRLCSLVDKLIPYTATFSDSVRYKQDKNVIGLVVFGVTKKLQDTIL